jgi:uncharacterized protein YbcI
MRPYIETLKEKMSRAITDYYMAVIDDSGGTEIFCKDFAAEFVQNIMSAAEGADYSMGSKNAVHYTRKQLIKDCLSIFATVVKDEVDLQE